MYQRKTPNIKRQFYYPAKQKLCIPSWGNLLS